ncbi:HEAT repeat domain-containing protein [Bacteriovorax sp. DB6_IX]|uniref:HEAT repeat domain-containing protein n=1 Tax=Bacteriovorax sp. DB6_IX TaxID=1353530 RepID=UPI00038A4561|nr:HEAT repeat domain-containing protein [Bacteriovorax sp. DB6_IX]EQC52383.1 HEAT repeat protein [Bacteriovorax sp. DB6_IX]
MKKISLAALFLLLTVSTPAKIDSKSMKNTVTLKLEKQFSRNLANKEMKKLKSHVLKMKGKSVPALINVMKNEKFPDKNRWMATFLLGQIMGKKSAPFISEFSKHPNWVMRMASLKTLTALKQDSYKSVYKRLLKDDSMIVRYQALESVKKLDLRDLSGNIWAMLYDKRNYHISKDAKSKKRTHIVKNIIKTVGDLEFNKAKKPLLSMIQKKKYKDIHVEIDYALSKITKKKSPEGLPSKKRFWKKFALANTVIK